MISHLATILTPTVELPSLKWDGMGWDILWVLTLAFSLSAHPQTYESEKEREKDDLIQARHSLSCDQIKV